MAAFDQASFSTSSFSPLAFDFGAAGFSLTVEAATFSVAGQDISLSFAGAQSSGGWVEPYDHQRARQRREEQEEREERELADRLEAVMLAEGSITKPDADLIRLRGLVVDYSELPNRAKRAALYAERARTEQALQLALKEIQRLHEEEELAVLLVLSLD